MDEHSPPTSKKSSAIGKMDMVETSRASPYHTRSRKNSNLTEENIAMHNDSPTTRNLNRRVTRRMSQGSESAIVLTPMPPATKRTTRRSPSVVSGDDVVVTPKKKFSVAQENVVMEEDEAAEENAVGSPSVNENGSSNVNRAGDKDNVSTMMNGSVSEPTIQQKSQTATETNSVVEQAVSTAAAREWITANANKPAVFNAETNVAKISTTPSKSPKPIGSTTESSDQTTNEKSKEDSIIVVLVSEPDSTSVAKAHDPSVDDAPKLTFEMSHETELAITNVLSDLEDVLMSSVSDSTDNQKMDDFNGTVLETESPAKSNVSAVDVKGTTPIAPRTIYHAITLLDTPQQAQKSTDDVIIIPDTPLENQKPSATDATIPTTPLSNLKTSVDVVKTPKTRQQSQKSSTTDPIIPTTPLSNLKTSVDVVKTPKTRQQSQKSSTTDPIIPTTPLSILKTSVNVVASPQTPKQTRKSAASDINIPETPQSIRKPSAGDETVPETPSPKTSVAEKQNSMAVTESEEELLLRTPPKTTHKSSTIEPLTTIASNAKQSSDGTPKSAESASTTTVSSSSAPAQNGIPDADEDLPKWGSSIRRKSDGQPIDKFGVSKENAEVATSLTVKRSTKDISVVSVRDSSDEEEEEDGSDEDRNMFVDDEAMESNGEASMDEEERQYLQENEIPEDGISLGSDSDVEVSDGNESNDDSFIVSDSSIQLLDGTGDDLELSHEKSQRQTSQRGPKRGNKIVDTSDEELEAESKPRKSSTSKRLSDAAKNQNKINESGDDDELANLDAVPPKTRSSKRLSDSKSLSKKEMKRQSLHPNMKLSSAESKAEKQESLVVADSSDDDVTVQLANLDAEPKKPIRMNRLSVSMSSSKKDLKRLSLHPNTKLSAVESNEKPETLEVIQNGPTTVDVSNEDVKDELANVDAEPKETKNSKRLSESNIHLKKDVKRQSLHPNIILNSLESNEKDRQTTINEDDSITVNESGNDDVTDELANLDAEPKKAKHSKRLSDSMSTAKKDVKRLSLHPNAKLNRSGVQSQVDEQKVPEIDANDEKMDVDEGNTAPSTSQQKVDIERSTEEIQARCDAILQLANEAKREDKLKNKVMQDDDKYQRLKEKKAAKLQEKREKEARRLEREELAAKQRQQKRDKKSKVAEITEEEKSKAIEKALAFGELIRAKKHKHSSDVTVAPIAESFEKNTTTTTTTAVKSNKRKRKFLQILDKEPREEPIAMKKAKRSQDVQISAKPEGFMISSQPVKYKKPSKDKNKRPDEKSVRLVEATSAGSFDVEILPKRKASPFMVTTLKYNPALKFNTFKDTATTNSNVKRETSAELLRRNKMQKKLRRN